MGDKNSVFMNNLAELSKLDNIQKYILGTKGNGQPRAVYDIIKDYSKHGKKKKHNNYEPSTYSIYLKAKKNGKKKRHKGGHNKNKYWHI